MNKKNFSILGLLALLIILPSWRDYNQNKPHIDPSMRSYEMRKKKKVDHFDFSGSFPHLDHIDIDGRRLKKVELDLSGEFPVLETLCFEGSFGTIEGALTGSFTKLEEVSVLSESATLDLDLRGEWENDATLNFATSTGNITLTLPKDVGVVVHTKTTTGKVLCDTMKKEGFFSVWKKTFKNSQVDKSPVTLTIHAQVTSGLITLQ